MLVRKSIFSTTTFTAVQRRRCQHHCQRQRVSTPRNIVLHQRTTTTTTSKATYAASVEAAKHLRTTAIKQVLSTMSLHSGIASSAKWLERATSTPPNGKTRRGRLASYSAFQANEWVPGSSTPSHDCTIPELSRVLGGASTGSAPSSRPAAGLELGSHSFMAATPTSNTKSQVISVHSKHLRHTSIFIAQNCG